MLDILKFFKHIYLRKGRKDNVELQMQIYEEMERLRENSGWDQ